MAAPLSETTLRRILGDGWGSTPRAWEWLDSEFDLNVRIDGDEGRSVLKIAGAQVDPEMVSLRAGALLHLDGRLAGVAVPRVMPLLDGRPWREFDVDGEQLRVWRITWLEGRALLDVRPRRAPLLEHLGAALAELGRALEGYRHPLLDREHLWDPARAGHLADLAEAIPAGDGRAIVDRVLQRWPEVEPRLGDCPVGVIHGDANDHNLVVEAGPDPQRVAGVFDFGDMMRTRRVSEIAIAAAYASFHADDVIGAIASVASGYDSIRPLVDEEIAVIGDLVRARLGISVAMSSRRARERPGEAYVTISEDAAWAVLRALDVVDPRWVTARVRDACGRAPFPTGPAVAEWLGRRAAAGEIRPILGHPIDRDGTVEIDLGVGSPMLGADPAVLDTEPLGQRIDDAMARAGAAVGIGPWDEPRAIYRAEAFAQGDHPLDEHRTVHLGVDLFVSPGTPLFAPIDGVVEGVAENTGAKDYGPVLLARHEPSDAPTFWTLWGHLAPDVLDRWAPGDRFEAGDELARVGAPPRNGDWPPHLHLQLVVDPLGRGTDLPGVAPARERSAWKAWFPDPSILCGVAPRTFAERAPSEESLVGRRRRLGTGLSLSYGRPLHLVRGWRQYLYDVDGRAFLDLYNNVPHVGHSHPAIVAAVSRQVALLNTNTRYLHRTILDYADALASRLPEGLDVVWILNSASEANELALRLARAATGRREVIVQDSGYHGHTTSLIAVSPYKFDGPGGEGRAHWVETVPIPDPYRGTFRTEDGEPGRRYGEAFAARVEEMQSAGRAPGAFLAETFPSVGGQIVPPQGYLARAYAAVREAGGLCIADEVQTGLGRLGDAFWGFETQGVVPDVVVVGKPAGNGMPLAAVISTRAVAEAFDTGMEFFSTFGGNPVSCAAGLAVLEVLDREALPARAAEVGGRLRRGLERLALDVPLFGDVRGMGLFLGVECVLSGDGREPAAVQARYVVERLREAGILAGTDGPDHNVIKLRGPLVVEESDVDRTLEVLAGICGEAGAQPDG